MDRQSICANEEIHKQNMKKEKKTKKTCDQMNDNFNVIM